MAVNTFAGITNLVNATSAAAKTEIIANINKIVALIPQYSAGSGTYGYGAVPASPDFDTIPPNAAAQIVNELNQFISAVTNGA